jgi:ribosomal protein S27AE
MPSPQRFNDLNKTSADFHDEVWVKCPACGQKGVASADQAKKRVRLTCTRCAYHKEKGTELSPKVNLLQPAHLYFDAELWLQAPFRDETFYAYNDRHLGYLEEYIRGTLRGHRDRQGFTLIERLPRFYHLAANRDPLLKTIAALKSK